LFLRLGWDTTNPHPSVSTGGSPWFHRLRKNSIGDDVLKGHGFSRAVNATKQQWALAPEGSSLLFRQKSDLFPQPLQPPAKMDALYQGVTSVMPIRTPIVF
jgi:hypothetical protein